MRENEKQANDPMGSEATPKTLEMGQAIRCGGKASEGHGMNHDSSDPKRLCTFLLQCKLNFQDCKDLFQDETTKVNYILSYLKGLALDCFKRQHCFHDLLPKLL